MKLTVDGTSHEATAIGSGTLATAESGAFTVVQTGHRRFALELPNAESRPTGNIEALILDGPALEGAHVNLKSRRKALYGNQRMRSADGKWQELTTATFGHDATGRADRLDRFMGVESGRFFLSHGGFVPGFAMYGERFTRPASGDLPAGIVLLEMAAPNAP